MMLKVILPALLSFTLLNSTANAVENTASVTPSGCPDSFMSLPLYSDARLCQAFDSELPASLVYLANTSAQNTESFYIAKLGEPDNKSLVKGRRVLRYNSGAVTIVVSDDAAGSQVDILVKAAL